MVQRKFPPTHEDKKAGKLMDKIAKIKAALEKKFREESSQVSSQDTQQNPGGVAPPATPKSPGVLL